MKTGLHPTTQKTSYVCNSCGETYTIISTQENKVQVEVCANCHPFYTGEEGLTVDTYSRIDKFKQRQEEADKTKVVKKRKKRRRRNSKVQETKADKKVTLRDMLKKKE